MVCLDARHAKKALDMKVNKTDANDAEGLAHMVRAGWCREVRIKSRNAMLAKALLGARSQLLSISLALENQIRGILKTFGRIVPKGCAQNKWCFLARSEDYAQIPQVFSKPTKVLEYLQLTPHKCCQVL